VFILVDAARQSHVICHGFCRLLHSIVCYAAQTGARSSTAIFDGLETLQPLQSFDERSILLCKLLARSLNKLRCIDRMCQGSARPSYGVKIWPWIFYRRRYLVECLRRVTRHWWARGVTRRWCWSPTPLLASGRRLFVGARSERVANWRR
jgi:hypothetical protein